MDSENKPFFPNQKIPLNSRKDKDGKTFFIGRMKNSTVLDFSAGMAVLVFTSEEEEEELQLAPLDSRRPTYGRYRTSSDRIHLSLDSREDKEKKVYYIGKLKLDKVMYAHDGITFMVYLSKKGVEEVQLVGKYGPAPDWKYHQSSAETDVQEIEQTPDEVELDLPHASMEY